MLILCFTVIQADMLCIFLIKQYSQSTTVIYSQFLYETHRKRVIFLTNANLFIFYIQIAVYHSDNYTLFKRIVYVWI